MASIQVHSGWLTKSPPDKKHQGRLKLFKAQWRRRYFVLTSYQSHSPGGDEEAPPVHCLHYYDNDKNPKKSRKKGCIDLSSCEEILGELESDGYRNVFSLRTQHKGKARTYCLAADSAEEMNHWISCLIRTLQMNDSGSSVTSPGTPGSRSQSTPNRKASYPLIKPATPVVQPLGAASPSHLSMQVDAPTTNFSAELAEARHGPRGSQSYYSPITLNTGTPSSSAFPFFPPTDPAAAEKDPAVPPCLPAKALRRGVDGDPCSSDAEAPLAASSSSRRRSGAAAEDKGASAAGQRRTSEILDVDDYDVLPARFQKKKKEDGKKDSDYDFPPFGLLLSGGGGGGGGGKPAKESSSSEFRAQRGSVSSHSDVFESMEDLVPHLNSASHQLPASTHMTPRTRSFRRPSSAKSDIQSPQTPMSTEQETTRSTSEDGEDYEQLQKDDESDYTDLLSSLKS